MRAWRSSAASSSWASGQSPKYCTQERLGQGGFSWLRGRMAKGARLLEEESGAYSGLCAQALARRRVAWHRRLAVPHKGQD